MVVSQRGADVSPFQNLRDASAVCPADRNLQVGTTGIPSGST